MLVWIVNPFDPLPGDPEQEGRYATLARLLLQRGHAVTWWTSSFSHRFKRPVDQAAIRSVCETLGLEARFLDAPPYYRNVGLARLHNHAQLARHFAHQASESSARPRVVVASSPPPALAEVAVTVGKRLGAKVLIDVQDAWPDVFASLAPRPLRPLLKPFIWALRGSVRRGALSCDAIVGVADAYIDHYRREVHEPKLTAMIPLGVDLPAFDRAVAAGRCPEYTRPAGQVWLAYTGSLNRNYDFLTILQAADLLRDRLGERVRFFLTGRGELAAQAERLVRERRLSNVTLTGFLPFETWAYLLSQCEVGFNASFPAAMIYLPNKVFYYLAAGCAVLNTIPGQCSRMIREAGCGLDYAAGDAASCAAAVERLVCEEGERAAMRRAARRLAETSCNRALLFPRYVELIERLGA